VVRHRLLVSLLAMLVVGAWAPSSAGAAWTAPVTIANGEVFTARVGIDRNGDAVFTWVGSDGAHLRIQARVRAATGALGPVKTLSAAGHNARNPQVAVNGDGKAIVTWEAAPNGAKCCWRIQARGLSSAGALSPIQTLSRAGHHAFGPQVGLDRAGDAVVTWDTNGPVQARAISAAGSLGPIQILSETGADPSVAVGLLGKAVFAWVHPGRNASIKARARSAAGALTPVQTLSPPPHPPGPTGQQETNDSPRVGIDAHGNALFLWLNYQVPDVRNVTRAMVRAGSATGDLSRIRVANLGDSSWDPQVAVNGAGDAAFAGATRYNHDNDYRFAWLRLGSTAGTLGPSADLANGDQLNQGFATRVGVDGAGDAVVTWERSDHYDAYLGVAVQVFSAAGVLGPLEILSPTGRSPEIAVNGQGNAVLTWVQFDGANMVIQAAAGP
jgi:hypothetical protein